MKKTVLSVLLVLLLSFVFMGCDKEEEPDPAELSSSAKKALVSMGIEPDDILVPAGCTFKAFDTFSGFSDDLIWLIWTNADSTKFGNYMAAWNNVSPKSLKIGRAVESPTGELVISEKTDFDTANIYFYTTGGIDDDTGMDVPNSSIVFLGSVPN